MSRSRPSTPDKAGRRARAAQMRAEQDRQDRRATRMLVGATAAVVAAVLAGAVWGISATREADVIVGLAESDPGEPEHVTEPITAAGLPPTGGEHNPAWQNCGVYTDPVPTETAVHSLEHGAVWISYQPDLPGEQVAALQALADRESGYVLVAPYADLAAPVVATAWGTQLQVEEASDERLARFVTRFANGPQTPEPGAPCDGGVGDPA